MKKKWKPVIFPLIISLLFLNTPQKTEASVSLSARSAILMEQQSGRVLFEKDAYTTRRIASITKIMTAILAIESGKMDKQVKISENAVRTEGSSIYLKPGEKIKLEDLVYGLMLRSGNDAATAIAEYVGGSVDGFSFLMNQKAKEIGMKNSYFSNPHGLDNTQKHYSTAYDMALLTRYAMMNDTYKKIAGTKVHRAPNPNESWDRVWKNKNRLLTELYEYSTGGKTGYTKKAKRTLVTTAKKGDLDLIAVTLDASDDWNDHIQMYEMAFKQYDLAEVLPKGEIKGIKDPFYKKRIYVNHSFVYPIKADEEKLLQIEYKLTKPQKTWKDQRMIPDVVGKAVVSLDGKPLNSMPIYYEKREEQKKSFFQQFKQIFMSYIGVKTNG